MNSWRHGDSQTEAHMYGREVLARRVNCYIPLSLPQGAISDFSCNAFVSLAIALFGEISLGQMAPDGSFM